MLHDYEDCICPKCKESFFRICTKLVPEDMHFKWVCSWCGHEEGDLKTRKEAKEYYDKKYGGIKNDAK